jgi:hypothetical protein
MAMSAGAASDRPRRADHIVLGRVITMSPLREVLEDGAVAIAGSDIVAVGSRPEVLDAYEPARVIEIGRASWSEGGHNLVGDFPRGSAPKQRTTR